MERAMWNYFGSIERGIQFLTQLSNPEESKCKGLEWGLFGKSLKPMVQSIQNRWVIL